MYNPRMEQATSAEAIQNGLGIDAPTMEGVLITSLITVKPFAY